MTSGTSCRSCGATTVMTVVDLGTTPLANSYLREENLDRPEPSFPLRAIVCESCWLMQLRDVVDPRSIFSDYAYFSSVSESWLRHAEIYARTIVDLLRLGPDSLVLEVASNDGYLLRAFRRLGVGVLGIEPAKNVADEAIAHGIPTEVEFLTTDLAHRLAADGVRPDLVIGNNVLAHVPDIRDFVEALRVLMQPHTRLTLEFPHVLNLLAQTQFDTIYHEHYSYLSLNALEHLFHRSDLAVVDVEELPTHGGSLRLHAVRSDSPEPRSPRVDALLRREDEDGITGPAAYAAFSRRVETVKFGLLAFLDRAHADGLTVAAYGAAAKGNTLLNTCRIGPDRIPFVVDRSPHKQGLFLPGSHIPILAPHHVAATHPDYLLVLPWNLADEIIEQMGHIRIWGGRFVVPIPTTRIVE